MPTPMRAGKAIAVMSSKGGVGKSTISLGLAETIACSTEMNVLLIDADPQGSITSMMEIGGNTSKQDRLTLSSLLSTSLGSDQAFRAGDLVKLLSAIGGSDIDGAEALDILPVGLRLIDIERRLTRASRDTDLVRTVDDLLDAARRQYDVIVVDCSPGLYLSTESWLIACDFQIAPIKADNISLSALDLVFDFRRANKDRKLSKWLGVVINNYQNNETERSVLSMIGTFDDLRVFDTVVPTTLALQRLAIKHGENRSYHAKYPGGAGHALAKLSREILARIAEK